MARINYVKREDYATFEEDVFKTAISRVPSMVRGSVEPKKDRFGEEDLFCVLYTLAQLKDYNCRRFCFAGENFDCEDNAFSEVVDKISCLEAKLSRAGIPVKKSENERTKESELAINPSIATMSRHEFYTALTQRKFKQYPVSPEDAETIFGVSESDIVNYFEDKGINVQSNKILKLFFDDLVAIAKKHGNDRSSAINKLADYFNVKLVETRKDKTVLIECGEESGLGTLFDNARFTNPPIAEDDIKAELDAKLEGKKGLR